MYRRNLGFLFVFLLMVCPVTLRAEQSGMTIQGTEVSLTGNLVILTVPESTGSSFCWTVIPNETSIGSYYICDGGRTLVFASRIAGVYHFILSAASGDEVRVLTHRLSYLEQDDITPLPPVIDEDSIYDWVQSRTKTLVSSDKFEQESEALANSLTQTVRMIESGQIRSPEQARTTQRSLARQYLTAVSPESVSQWQNWQNTLAEKLTELDSNGKLDSLEQIADVFRQIARGLRNLSKTTTTEERSR